MTFIPITEFRKSENDADDSDYLHHEALSGTAQCGRVMQNWPVVGGLNRWHFADSVFFAALLVLVLAVRAQTFRNPVLGYDEQYYLLVADRMLHGALPYVDIWDRKPVGLFLIYALAARLGDDPFLQYKLLASSFVFVTACAIFRMARPIAGNAGAIMAACLYVIWLNLMEGGGGQSQVFYNLPMAIAGLLIWRIVRGSAPVRFVGCVAMLLVGFAIQIKYTALFEGVFFGCALVWVLRRVDRRPTQVMMWAAAWISCALLPTVLAMLIYWYLGALNAFLFANFVSPFGVLRDGWTEQLSGLAEITVRLGPLLVLALVGVRGKRAPMAFVWWWLVASVAGVVLFGTFRSPQYAMATLVPMSIAAAPFFTEIRWQQPARGLAIVFALIAGQVDMWRVQVLHGGASQAKEIAQAAQPFHGCLYVYAGYPALYELTHSCLPTRWVFPIHLNAKFESSVKALGVDPLSEERRILLTRPEVIVDETPMPPERNPTTHALLAEVLHRDYYLAAHEPTGPAHDLLVYRRKQPLASQK